MVVIQSNSNIIVHLFSSNILFIKSGVPTKDMDQKNEPSQKIQLSYRTCNFIFSLLWMSYFRLLIIDTLAVFSDHNNFTMSYFQSNMTFNYTILYMVYILTASSLAKRICKRYLSTTLSKG
jgi:hypothetical protein